MESTCTQWLWFERRQIDLGDETQAQYNQCSKEAYRIQKYTNFPLLLGRQMPSNICLRIKQNWIPNLSSDSINF